MLNQEHWKIVLEGWEFLIILLEVLDFMIERSKDVLAYLRLVINLKDTISLEE